MHFKLQIHILVSAPPVNGDWAVWLYLGYHGSLVPEIRDVKHQDYSWWRK